MIFVEVSESRVVLSDTNGVVLSIPDTQLSSINKQLAAAENWFRAQRKARAELAGRGEPDEDTVATDGVQ